MTAERSRPGRHDIEKAIEVVASGGDTLDLSDLRALRTIVHFAIDCLELSPFTEASRRDILIARGWVACRECGGEGVFQCQHWNHIAGDTSNGCKPDRFCAACVDGLVPTDEQVEVVSRGVCYQSDARTVLIEDARRMKP